MYVAKREDLRLVKKPRYPIRGASGEQVDVTPGEVLQFRNGVLHVPKKGTLQLEDGREVDAAELIPWLDKHRLYGDKWDGFWRLDPAAPPVSAEEQATMFEAAMALDVDTLERMLEQEQAGWNRDELVALLKGGIEKIHAALNAALAEPEGEKK